MKYITLLLLASSALFAQNAPVDSNPLVNSNKMLFAMVKDSAVRSAEKVPEDVWSFKPTPEIRSWGQLVAHLADGQYEFCGAAATGKPIMKDFEKNLKTKADIVAALKESFAYCDTVWAGMTDATAAQPVSLFGMKMTKLSTMSFNTAHSNEHYGNMVTYMRLKGIVPASSEPRK